MTESKGTVRRNVLVGGLAAATLIGAPTGAFAADPIKFGLALQLTGPLAGNGKAALVAAQIWADEVNAGGGLLGRPVELVVYDDQSNPGLVPGIYTKLLDIDKVDFLLANNTNQTMPAMPIAIQRERLMFAAFAMSANTDFGYKRYFQIQPYGPNGKEVLGRGFLSAAMKLDPKPKTIALVGSDAEHPKNALEGARKVIKELGLQIVYDQFYPPSTVNFTPILRAIQARNPDLVFVGSYPADTVGMIRTAREIKLETKMFGGAMVGTQYAVIKQQLGAELNGIVNFEQYIPEPTVKFPTIDAFLVKYQARAKDQGTDTLGYYVPAFIYSAFQVLGDAIAKTGGVDQDKVAEYIHKTTFGTVVGDIKFGSDGEWSESRMFTVQYRGISGNGIEQHSQPGHAVILYPDAFKSGDLVAPLSVASK